MSFLTYFKAFFSFLPLLDIFGCKVQFLIDCKNSVKTKIGGLFSIFLIVVFLYSFVRNFESWINGEQLRMISKYDSFTIDEIQMKNLSLLYELDYSNYNIYFLLTSKIGSDRVYNEKLQKYLTFKMIYYDVNSFHPRDIQWEYCSNKKMHEFLNLNENLQNDSVNLLRICIKDGQNIKIGYAYDKEEKWVNTTSFQFMIQKCRNSSENNFSCASEKEINDVIKTSGIQISLPKSYYDFNDVRSTRKRSFDNQFYYLDSNIYNSYFFPIVPIYLLIDRGLTNTQYTLDSIDFNSEASSYQSKSPDDFDGVIFSYEIIPSFNQQYYYLKNENIFWLISSIGGSINFFLLLGNVLIFFYNCLVLKHKLMNFSFSFDGNEK